VRLNFVKVESLEPVINYLQSTLNQHLANGENVLWMVSGGSAVKLAVTVAGLLRRDYLEKLTFTLVDERFGPVGHANSNWSALERAGLDLPGATLLPVLTGQSLKATQAGWSDKLSAALDAADYRLGLLGIGPDGHTSGILPHTSAVSATGTTYAYDGGQFERITTTFDAITRLDEAVVYAVGEAKRSVLERLKLDLPLTEQPAQILKSLPVTTIFNDQIGGQL
jgi:6-phosphogluconolactonase/glucosamine-6-phosphate isomerase/deaminase